MYKARHPSFVLILTSLLLIFALAGGTWSTAYGAGLAQGGLPSVKPAAVIPTFSIVSVQTDQSVTIKTFNFPANDTFNVLMNTIGTRGVGGVLVATQASGTGGTFTATYSIPASLKGLAQIAIRLESPTSGFFAYNWFWNNTSGGIPATGATATPMPSLPAGTIPTFSIASVVADHTVTITTSNFPANDTFNVLMNTIGTRGVGGIVVATQASGAGGTFTATYNIPAALLGSRQIAIRLESPTSGFFAYNWFWNNTSGGIPATGATVTPGPSPTPLPSLPAGTIPTFSISSVVADTSVTILTNNFPANDTFNVLMNFIGTRGVGGTQVATINSGAGGALTLTFNIPAGLKGQQQIAIRLQSPTSGFFAYNWFWNNTTGGIPATGATVTPGPSATPLPSLPAGTIPTFTITGVAKNSTVTIQTANFPANDTFNVTMGAFGTLGIGGISAGTFTSGAGGVMTATFNIPAALQGSDRIAIRLQSPTSGFFAYNWFWNNTFP
ncbi:MAG TPA: hypothetical protein VF806_00170 [Anaerolineaceae bacterium]